MQQQFCMVLTTVNSESVKKTIIEQVLAQGLAACIQTFPIQSCYIWEGKVCEDEEQLLVIKTTTDCYPRLEETIVNHHNYEVPQVVQVPFSNGFQPYLNWIKESTL